ncbi:hypothetical protein LUCX_41 [Xanthomonas phage vB_XciM_LucasX]|nr:hypothetical protein LUCX_41 [Xanthomonas phage vB_XciM_LucasX]
MSTFENFTVRTSALFNNPTLVAQLEAQLLAIAPTQGERYVNIEKTPAPANSYIKPEQGVLSVSWVVNCNITGIWGQVNLVYPTITEVVYSDDPTGVDLMRKAIAARQRIAAKLETWFINNAHLLIEGVRQEAAQDEFSDTTKETWVQRARTQYAEARKDLMRV